MTDAEKEKLREGFQKSIENLTEEKNEDDPWTDEAILAVAKKILKRMGLDEKYL